MTTLERLDEISEEMPITFNKACVLMTNKLNSLAEHGFFTMDMINVEYLRELLLDCCYQVAAENILGG